MEDDYQKTLEEVSKGYDKLVAEYRALVLEYESLARRSDLNELKQRGRDKKTDNIFTIIMVIYIASFAILLLAMTLN